MGKLTFKEFLILESKNQFVVTLESVLKKLVKEYASIDDADEMKEFKTEATEQLKKSLTNVINTVVKDGTYIEDKELVENLKSFMKLLDFSDKLITMYFEASLDANKRDKFESKLQSLVADDDGKKETKEKKEKDEDETDEKIAQVAKDNARTGKGDAKLEKEVEDEIENEKKEPKKLNKILLGIIKKERDGDILSAIVGNTDLAKKDIEGLEYEKDVLDAIVDARNLKTPAEITNYVKKLKGTVVYFYDPVKKEKDLEFWKVEKY